MNTLHYFDITVGVIIVLLGLKGVLNGFFKELFGLVGVIGGIFVASRIGDDVGEFVNNLLFHFTNHSAVSFTGFLVTFAVFWTVMILIGSLFKSMSNASGLGAVDKFFGFVVGSGKFFLIAAVIFFAVNNIKAVHKNLAPLMETSILYPILVETGEYIMKIDPTEVSSQIEKKIDTTGEQIENASKKMVDEQAEAFIDKAKKQIEKAKESTKDE